MSGQVLSISDTDSTGPSTDFNAVFFKDSRDFDSESSVKRVDFRKPERAPRQKDKGMSDQTYINEKILSQLAGLVGG